MRVSYFGRLIMFLSIHHDHMVGAAETDRDRCEWVMDSEALISDFKVKLVVGTELITWV
jgi:hypothetical protein